MQSCGCGVDAKGLSGEDLVQFLHRFEGDFGSIESCSISVYSPCAVGNAEELFRALDQPTHLQNGVIVPAAFSDAEMRGLSVNRLGHISTERAVAMAQDRVAAQNKQKGYSPDSERYRSAVAYCTFLVSDLRNIMTKCGKRGYVVLDTAEKLNVSHSDVVCVTTNKQLTRSVRSRLFELANAKLQILTC